jgi:hypothetical protein
MADMEHNRCSLSDQHRTRTCTEWGSADFLNVSKTGTYNYHWIVNWLKYINTEV